MKHLIYMVIQKNLIFFKIIFVISLVISLTDKDANAQNNLDVIKNNWIQYSDAPNSLNRFLTAEAYKLLESRKTTINKIQTAVDWRNRQSNIRESLWEMLGSFPEKSNLNAKITSSIKKNGYKVENIVYESVPGFYVTASLFIPDNVKKPAPAILFCSGHSAGVYRLEYYQLPLLNLVKKGFIILAIDPIGQGERLQYFDPVKGESTIGSSTLEHSYPSPQVFLLAKSIARYFLWDGIRGIDYLVSRAEVDPKRIGVHGLSGGGTQTAYISAMDERVAASAPAGYITGYQRLLESIGVQDGEQNFYHETSNGIDHADFIELRAPKPTLIMATTEDFFSIQGARETFNELKGVYSILGKPDYIELTEDTGGHGYTKKNREAMYAFFQKYLQLSGSSLEEEVDFSTPLELQKTSSGQVSTSLGGETVFSLNRKEAEKMVDKLQVFRKNSPDYLSEVVSFAKKLSGYITPSEVQNPVFTGRLIREGYAVEKYFIKGEGDYVIPYLLMVPDKANNKSLIYLHSSDKSAEALTGGEMEWFVKNGFTVLAPDLIGMGELGSVLTKGDAIIDGFSYNKWYTSVIIGRSIVGIRAGDVVRLTSLLKKRSGTIEVFGLAKKEMAPVMLYAAAFDPDIARIALIEPYSSYQSIVMNRYYYPGFVENLVPGALTAYDLPDLAATLAPRMLMMVGTTDGNRNIADQESINKDLSIIKTEYQLKGASEKLIIDSPASTEKTNDHFLEWIK
ncbi:MAG: prolyl oligopeptidase family serine peptidase [Mariniphaga sp.]|nr:prolyl oligopeptidase family serine peptidase [Mariniphaga sp.]